MLFEKVARIWNFEIPSNRDFEFQNSNNSVSKCFQTARLSLKNSQPLIVKEKEEGKGKYFDWAMHHVFEGDFGKTDTWA